MEVPKGNKFKKKIVASILCIAGFLSFFLTVPTAVFAQKNGASPTTAAIFESWAGILPGNLNAGEAARDLNASTVKPTITVALVTGVLDAFTYLLDRFAYESAVAIASGGPGEDSLFYRNQPSDAYRMFAGDVYGQVLENLSDALQDNGILDFDICAPPNDFIVLGITLGIRQAYKPEPSRCNIFKVYDNWGQVVTNARERSKHPNEFLLGTFSVGLRPGQNELSASLTLHNLALERIAKTQQLKTMEQLFGGSYKPLTNFITGQVETPSALLEAEFSHQMVTNKDMASEKALDLAIANTDILDQLFGHVLSTFTNTLLSTLLKEVFEGLFPAPGLTDPFNFELDSPSNRDAAVEQFSNLISRNPISPVLYNALAEFVACPTGGMVNRNINNCVVDPDLGAALAREGSGAAVTVRQAMEQGMLHPNWILVSPKNLTKNQDPFCYSSAYCYGNLVKLRKARILPIGWEIAAESNTVTNPATLREIVDGFNDCNEQGLLDGNHKWCHLIDPNWVIKYPETQCRAVVNGEITFGQLIDSRNTYCADSPSCVNENDDGSCAGAYGYCVREKNIWRFRGDECPAEFATCLAFDNTFTGENGDWLLNTVDFSVCGKDNAGCKWYRTGKYFDDKGTVETNDDSFEWLATGDTYNVQDRDEDISFQSSGTNIARDSYTYNTGLSTNIYSQYAFEDRVYLTNKVESCSVEASGCSRVYRDDNNLYLNLIRNGSFENDLDADGVPDGWILTSGDPTTMIEEGDAFRGSKAATPSSGSLVQEGIVLSPSSFYTLSGYIKENHTETTGQIRIAITDTTGNDIQSELVNLAYTDTACKLINSGFNIDTISDGDNYVRRTCTFTTPNFPTVAKVLVQSVNQNATKIDAVQLELGERVNSFEENGYSVATRDTTYLKLAPSYLGCDGADNQPSECDNYAQVCAALDVGCSRYAPADGDPSVPAVVSPLDGCPTECVGYDTYKQEAPDNGYDVAVFPLFFIPETAQSCTEQNVGCDSFTNLDTLESGGESVEHYTNLRRCLTPDMTSNTRQKTGSTFFTWEGSDVEGFQLKTWDLLESDLLETQHIDYTEAGVVTDDFAKFGPCVNSSLNNENSVVCEDSGSITELQSDDSCNEHDDIFFDNDCREFFDSTGNVHYRRFSQTTTVNSLCTPYRKTNSENDSCLATGGFFTDAGECRYFGLAFESTSCPSAAAGCREFTGGAGRNASTLLHETFEAAPEIALESFVGLDGSILYSNESIVADGHSLRVISSQDNGGVTTVDNTFTGQLVAGKTFVVQFWAKGDGAIDVFLKDTGSSHDFTEADVVNLTPDWQLYSVGPLDTSKTGFDQFDDTALLQFLAESSGTTFYLDNIQFKQVEENITLIKDSWVTPSTCDTALDNSPAPQFYLGCEAYTNQNGDEVDLYQFDRLCNDASVGCDAFFDTKNSVSPYTEVYNARCQYDTNNNPNDDETVSGNTACAINGVTYCTISTARQYCVFDAIDSPDSVIKTIPTPLPANSEFKIVMGPEAVIVNNDTPTYLIDNGSGQCGIENVGCQAVGLPKYSVDKKTIESFETKGFINDPSRYDEILCDNEALFCEEYSTTKDGNFYFKDPVDKECEYRRSVNLNGHEYYGWFQNGTSEPCYGDDPATPNDETYLIAGEEFGIWRNGDPLYDGWAGTCGKQYDLCTEFIDPTDTQEGEEPRGTSYFFLNDKQLGEDSLSQLDRCQGLVGLENGCALFNNKTISKLKYSSEVTYLASEHADKLFGNEKFSLVDPISCPDGGEITMIDGTVIDLCQNRCLYNVGADNNLVNLSTDRTGLNLVLANACLSNEDCIDQETTNRTFVKGDCRTISEQESNYWIENDTNELLKVNLDRECSQWLQCSSSRFSFDKNSGRYEEICDEIDLCNRIGVSGDSSDCTRWVQRESEVLTPSVYASRDITWTGQDYSGYSIPNQLPVEKYSQVNINPARWCTGNNGRLVLHPETQGQTCSSDSDCAGECTGAPENFVLAYEAGTCDEDDVGRSGACTIGFCRDSNESCSAEDDCRGDDECIVGYCQDISSDTCDSDADCTDINHKVCEDNFCVSNAAREGEACLNASDCHGQNRCTPTAKTFDGSCFNDKCLTTLSGDPIAVPNSASINAEALTCRGYPEANAPFSDHVVDQWTANFQKISGEGESAVAIAETIGPYSKLFEIRQDGKLPGGFSSKDAITRSAQPTTKKSGFQSVNTCAPFKDTAGNWVADDCICSYTKAEYGNNQATRYYPVGSRGSEILKGVCVNGSLAGSQCTQDSECQTEGNFIGTCAVLKGTNDIIGWEGYCIEKDTSINLFGESDNDARACLTWLPIDQLTGATDLFGKFTSAGYEPQDTYYCAEVDTFYNLQTTSIGCAETDSNVLDFTIGCEEAGRTSSWFSEESCFRSSYCPIGYFGIISGCGDKNPINTCGQDQTFGDCPFYCVPKYSLHTTNGSYEDLSWKIGDPCLPPNSNNAPNAIASAKKSPNSASFYLVSSTWNDNRNYYQDCVVKGLDIDTATEYWGRSPGLPPPSNAFEENFWGDNKVDYSKLSFTEAKDWEYLGCKKLVQTSATSLIDGYYNKAWNNRVSSSHSVYNIKDTVDALSYGVLEKYSPFASSTDLNLFEQSSEVKFDGKPMAVGGICEISTSRIGGDCADDQRINIFGKCISLIEKPAPLGCTISSFPLINNPFANPNPINFWKDWEDNNGDPLPLLSNETFAPGWELNYCEKITTPQILEDCPSDLQTVSGGRCRTFVNVDDKGDCPSGSHLFEASNVDTLSFWDVSSNNPLSTKGHLSQIFAQSYATFNWFTGLIGGDLDPTNSHSSVENGFNHLFRSDQKENFGEYSQDLTISSFDLSDPEKDLIWDNTATGYGSVQPIPPTVASVGNCEGVECETGREGAFSVNGIDSGDIVGDEGSRHISLQFFAWSNDNQGPLRNIIVDWGDGAVGTDKNEWGSNQKGSQSKDNFYKNHRGTNRTSGSQCDGSTFGRSTDACDPSYISFTHDYICTKNMVETRVHVKDNWGWCSGTCEGGFDQSGGCYDASKNLAKESFTFTGDNECDIQNCPGGKDCVDSQFDNLTINPWINFEGEIQVSP